jgi:hypothetical protein
MGLLITRCLLVTITVTIAIVIIITTKYDIFWQRRQPCGMAPGILVFLGYYYYCYYDNYKEGRQSCGRAPGILTTAATTTITTITTFTQSSLNLHLHAEMVKRAKPKRNQHCA